MKKTTILSITVLLVSYSFLAHGQGDALVKSNNKNAIIANFAVGNLYAGNIYYERVLFPQIGNTNINTFARGGVVHQVMWYDGANTYLTTQLGMIWGPSAHKLEIAAGVNILNDAGYWPAANIGYRYQNNRPIAPVCRIGFSYPQGAYLGIGLSF